MNLISHAWQLTRRHEQHRIDGAVNFSSRTWIRRSSHPSLLRLFRRVFEPHLKRLNGDRGAVESALVLIPSLLFFLGVLQIGGSVMARMSVGSEAQSQVSKVALLNSPESTPGMSVAQEPLPGGGEILIGTRSAQAPMISPLVGGSDQFDAFGIALNENK